MRFNNFLIKMKDLCIHIGQHMHARPHRRLFSQDGMLLLQCSSMGLHWPGSRWPSQRPGPSVYELWRAGTSPENVPQLIPTNVFDLNIDISKSDTPEIQNLRKTRFVKQRLISGGAEEFESIHGSSPLTRISGFCPYRNLHHSSIVLPIFKILIFTQ